MVSHFHYRGFFLGSLLFLLLLSPEARPSEEPLQVVVSFPVIGSWTQGVGGEEVDVFNLVGDRASVHTYEPLPRDLVRLREADLIVANGLGLEFWLDELLAASRTEAPLVLLSDGMPRLQAPAADLHQHAPGETCLHHSEGLDPHLWMNPQTAGYMVMALAEALAEVRPASAEAFIQNAEDWIWETRTTAYEIRQTFESLPADRRKLVTHHRNLAYWADFFEFTVLGSALDSVSSHHEDPSAAHLADLIRTIRTKPRVALLYADRENPQLLRQISRETGMPLVGPIYVETLPPAGRGGEGHNYARMLRYNANALVEALESPADP